ncbi:hypothetical protein [Anaerococcus sp. Marseille-Q7828]|uniref:hypothetical protein n=1 Tax=Anaerococcus sp. Marseille-Q7828 TaxID=3036300 RepID=UPI0024ACCB17|nr:hypothetical protein [Anaerococcus sp. Marseille-Q7828]
MTDTNKEKINSKRELKALSLILFVIVGFSFITKDRLIIFAILASLILLIVGAYIRENNLKISKAIYYLVISFYNIASIFSLLEYFKGQESLTKIEKYIFKPFIINDKIDIRYIGWILILTTFLFILENMKKNPNEGNNDR